MAPSFYGTSLSPSFFISGASRQSSHIVDNNLPTLAVVLSLIGVIVALALVASVFMYVFRRRLFPPVESVDDEEKIRSDSEAKNLNFDRASFFSIRSNGARTPRNESEEPLVPRPVLRPFLLDAAKPGGSRYKELLLPRLQRVQLYRPVRQGQRTAPTKHLSLPSLFGGGGGATQREDRSADPRSLRTSQSCPASLEGSEINLNSDFNEDPSKAKLKDLRLVSELSLPPPPSLMYSYDSSGSVYSVCSEDSEDSSNSSGSVNWNYYLDDDHEGLFYEPESSSPGPSAFGEQDDAPAIEGNLYANSESLTFRNRTRNRLNKQVLPSARRPTSTERRANRRRASSFQKKHGDVARSLKAHNLRIRATQFAEARLRYESARPVGTTWADDTATGCISNTHPCDLLSLGGYSSNRELDERATEQTVDPHSSSKNTYLTNAPPRSSSRQPFSVITNLPPTPRTIQAQPPTKENPTPSENTRPFFLLNDIPTEDLTSTSPPHFTCLQSPPHNPALLNARWIPRPADPPLNITIFAKDRSALRRVMEYPGRRVTIAPPAGTSLEELRGLVERALGLGAERNVRMLKGMVFVGNRTVYLPLATERFFTQWVKERVRDGGSGIVEAWYN